MKLVKSIALIGINILTGTPAYQLTTDNFTAGNKLFAIRKKA
jgi:hypothetical protein